MKPMMISALSAALMLSVLHSWAGPLMAEPVSEVAALYANVMEKSLKSNKGVIMVLSERGDVAAQAAMLLAAQVQQNPDYAPLLMVSGEARLKAYMQTLALPAGSLPAVIFFDKSGRELNRVIAALPVFNRPAQMQARVR